MNDYEKQALRNLRQDILEAFSTDSMILEAGDDPDFKAEYCRRMAKVFAGRIATLLTEPSGDIHADIIGALKRENPDIKIEHVQPVGCECGSSGATGDGICPNCGRPIIGGASIPARGHLFESCGGRDTAFMCPDCGRETQTLIDGRCGVCADQPKFR